MQLDHVKTITIKQTLGNAFVLVADTDDGRFWGVVRSGDGWNALARILRHDYACPVTVWFGNRQDPKAIVFQT